MTAAAAGVIDRAREPDAPLFLLCDGDLGASAAELVPLLDAVRAGECDLAIAAFRRRVGRRLRGRAPLRRLGDRAPLRLSGRARRSRASAR